jgi:hypothetical protein
MRVGNGSQRRYELLFWGTLFAEGRDYAISQCILDLFPMGDAHIIL